MTPTDGAKQRAARRAAEYIEDGMRIGLGTGSTAAFFLEALASRRAEGELQTIAGVPTSRATEHRARELGIPLITLEDVPRLDMTVDGADEVDPELRLIKGMGGALLREKIVASASDRLLVIIDDGKLVDVLGESSPLPVEIAPFGWNTHHRAIRGLGGEPVLRVQDDGEPVVTDGGHWLLDCRFAEGISDASGLDRALRSRPGVVETGLFIDLATRIIVGTSDSQGTGSGEERQAAGIRELTVADR